MKLCIQIPCLNEAETLPLVLAGIPKSIPGIDLIEIVVIDDGSRDGTGEVALKHGVTEVIRQKRNLGLAFAFRKGLDTCLARGADIIVNMDGDNQYKGADLARLIEPIMLNKADIVIGSRNTDNISHFSVIKKLLQRYGSQLVRQLSRTQIQDTVSGFRAFSREAAIKLTILSNYTYTLESILQVHTKGLTIVDIPIEANPKTRESRLISSLRAYLAFSAATIIRVFAMYNPLRIFVNIGLFFIAAGLILCARFLFNYIASGGSAGLVQSLVFAAICLITGMTIILAGLLADLIQFNRRLLEDILERVKRLELSKK